MLCPLFEYLLREKGTGCCHRTHSTPHTKLSIMQWQFADVVYPLRHNRAPLLNTKKVLFTFSARPPEGTSHKIRSCFVKWIMRFVIHSPLTRVGANVAVLLHFLLMVLKCLYCKSRDNHFLWNAFNLVAKMSSFSPLTLLSRCFITA